MGKGYPGQGIRNAQHAPALKRTLDPPIEITARIEWLFDGPETINTVALAWSGRIVQVVMTVIGTVGQQCGYQPTM
jgi:hypothetical protein